MRAFTRRGGPAARLLGIGRACRGKHDGAPHHSAGQVQCAGCFTHRGTGCEDVINDDAGAPCHLCPGPGLDPHGPPDALGTGSPPQAFLAGHTSSAAGSAGAGEDGARPWSLAQHIRDVEPWMLPCRRLQEQVDRAEAPADVGRRAGGHGDQEASAGARDGGPDCTCERPAKASAKLRLAVPFERQQSLRQLVPVHPRCHDGKHDGAGDIHKGRSSAFGPEWLPGQLADAAGTGWAQGAVFGPAADTVHRDGQGEQIRHGAGQPVGKAKEGGRVFTPVQRRPGRGRLKVRIHPPGPPVAGTGRAVPADEPFHGSTVA
ncbi:hypothetical protein StoSoilB19_25800 [Arthrobacter sp. StoSoilB19]|nr:hypothetical protein StoSoilB19_25800 [Arthrobacter sp. StoSoilB19]